MPLELNLYFPDSQHVTVSLISDNSREKTELLDFSPPFSKKDFQQLHWYLEKYATQYSTDINFDQAGQITKKLPLWGHHLFNPIFSKRAAYRLFKKFQEYKEPDRVLTISSHHWNILSLPWELLYPSIKGGRFLMFERPPISIRRRLSSVKKRTVSPIHPKSQLHLLYVLSRPNTLHFTEPRAGAIAVINLKRGLQWIAPDPMSG